MRGSRFEQRGVQHVGVEMSRVVRLSTLYARQPHLGGAEEQGVDLVEIAVVPLEDVVERRPVVLRCRRGNLGNQLGELGVIGLDGIARLAAVRSEERRVGKECRCRWWSDKYYE